jgi:uncharacterized protein YeaO (DUF488 family)
MTLHVHTARLTYAGPGRLDITRATADKYLDAPGRFWAPRWRIVADAKRAFAHAEVCRSRGELQRADQIAANAWWKYERAYHDEMVISFRRHRDAWVELLARDSVTLVCYCAGPSTCHRRLLAGYLGQLGAVVVGERTAEEQQRRRAG